MLGKKILFLLAGYVAGNILTREFSGKKKSAKNLEQMFQGFMQDQEKILQNFEKKYLSEESQKILFEKKKQLKKGLSQFLSEAKIRKTNIQSDERFIKSKSFALDKFKSFQKKGKAFLDDITKEDTKKES